MAMITSTQFTNQLKTGVQAIKEKETQNMKATLDTPTVEATTQKKSLYGVNMSFEAIMHRLEDIALDDEQNPEEIEALEALIAIEAEDFLEVAERYGFVIEEMEARAKQLKEKAAAWTKLAKAKTDLSDRLKSKLLEAMVLRGERKVETESHVISLRKSEAVNILDEDEIPAIYVKTKLTSAPDKAEIKKALKQGLEVSGAVIVERQSVQIK